MKILASILLGLLTSSALARGFCDKNRARTIADQLSQLSSEIKLDLIDFSFFDDDSFVAGYEYEVEPAYINGLYARTDRWQITSSILPNSDGTLAEQLTWKNSLGAKQASEATFIRFFQDPCLAETSLPYSPKRIPLSAEIALGKNFNVGDYFVFKSSLGFVASGEILQLLSSSLWGFSLSGSYLTEGSYQVYVVRENEKTVRLKIVAHRGQEGTLGLDWGWSGNFEVFDVKPLDHGLKKVVNPKPIKLEFKDKKANVFLVDYILDLTDPAVADAYNKIIRKANFFLTLELARPFRKIEKLEDKLILDLAPLEDLFRADVANNNVARIRRNLRSSAGQNGQSFGFDLGNKIIGLDFDAGASSSRITLREDNNSISQYLLRSFDRTMDGHFAFSWSRLYNKRSVDVLLQADETYQHLSILNLVQTLERKDKRFSKSEFEEIEYSLRKALPKEIFDEIPFYQWNQIGRKPLENFGFRFQIVMGPELILNAPQRSQRTLRELYSQYISEKGLTATDFFPARVAGRPRELTPEEELDKTILRISSKLSQVSDSQRSDIQRLEAFMALRDNTLFAQTGIGFLMTLVDNQNYRIDINLSANGHKLDFAKGDEAMAHFFRKLSSVKSALEDDGLDLRREAESLTIKVKNLRP